MRIDKRGYIYRNEEEWVKVINKFDASSFELQEFCRRESLNPKTFKKWQKRLSSDNFISKEFVEIAPALISRGSKVELVFESGLLVKIES